MNKRLSLYICYSIITAIAVMLTITSPLLPEMALTFNFTMAKSGILFTSSFVGFACFIFIGGILADLMSKKRVVTISLIGLAVSSFFFSVANNPY
ncbi:MAG TPA: MFS transporter, partial [Clostridia bacterium]|nr:MFS transporter [Clostridia bacterium]